MRAEHPLIRLEPLGIEALNLRPAQDAIRAQYGPRYHVSEDCLREVAALWGAQPHEIINDAGVFMPYRRINHRAGSCSAELRLATSPSSLWAMSTSSMSALCGYSSAPSVWNRHAFLNEADAIAAGLHELITRFRALAAEGGSEASNARKLVDLLEMERMPQLSLF